MTITEHKTNARTWRWFRMLSAAALMLIFVTTSVRFAANSLPLYEALFERHDVSSRTGITDEDLRGVGRQVQDYFSSDTEPLLVTAEVFGRAQDLFTVPETEHMADVKQLFLRTYRAQGAAALYLIIVGVLAVATLRRSAVGELGRWLRWGAVLTAASILVIGVASVVAFDPVFNLFHALGFPQGNYAFDTRTSLLVQIFPFGFWRDVTLVVGAITLGQAGLAWVVGCGLGRYARGRQGSSPSRTGS